MTDQLLTESDRQMIRDAHCWTAEIANRHQQEAHGEALRPFMLLKPKLYKDGNEWCALYGENTQEGVCGFGPSPAKAAYAFDVAWNREESAAESTGGKAC